jgi:molybdopterin-guanine dinucleotide biosynthesis protein A
MARPKMKSKRRLILCQGKPVSLIVLAGGRGRRMGRGKALLPVGGGTLLGHVLGQVAGCFDDVLISLSPGQRLDLDRILRERCGRTASLASAPPRRREAKQPAGAGGMLRGTPIPSLRIVRDAFPGQGPMAGVLAGLREARHDVCAVVACDIPDVPLELLRRMARAAAPGYDAVVPVTAGGLMEPLFAVYRRTSALKMKELLAAGRRSLLDLFDRVKTRRFPLAGPRPLKNLNTPGEYRAYLASIPRRSPRRRVD